MPSPHAGSGTGWQPASVPANEWMWMRGGWELMAHGVIFVDYNQQGGPRGAGKAESVNWGMLMEQHKLGAGTILFRQMFSAESLTSPHPGFPELFQTGETYHGEPLVDHQHPHNVFAELSLLYTVAADARNFRGSSTAGLSAEPALGPVTYIHRASASELPMAPLSHHLQDSTHTSFGVVTTGLVIDRVRAGGLRVQRTRTERKTLEHSAGRAGFLVGAGQRRSDVATGRRNTAWGDWSIPRRRNRAASGGRRRRWNTTGRWQRATGPRRWCGGACTRSRRHEPEQLSAGVDVEFPAA